MATKTHFTVVRNAAYRAGDFKTRSRHNERENDVYQNGDVVLERSNLNVHYKQNFSPDGSVESYQQTFERLLSEGKIVKRGLKEDAKVFDELVFDVNSDYFEQNGGYDFAVRFFEEAYRLAVKEVGSEDYILSAMLHADERNSALSEKLGYDVYHYHLHVVYVPVVEKEVLWSKRCKDPTLVGTVKEVIPQISHSKKWPKIKTTDEKGKTRFVNSYSLLQDRYFEHMKAAGFDGFERGERGSTAEHLDVLDYKIQQDEKRLDVLDTRIEKRQEHIEKLDEKIAVKQSKAATLAEINAMGKPALLGGVNFSDDEAKRLKSLARQTVKADERMAKLKRDMDALQAELDKTKTQLQDAKIEANHWHREYTTLLSEVKDFINAIRKFPQRLREFISELFRPEREEQQRREAEHQAQIQERKQQRKSYDIGGR